MKIGSYSKKITKVQSFPKKKEFSAFFNKSPLQEPHYRESKVIKKSYYGFFLV